MQLGVEVLQKITRRAAGHNAAQRGDDAGERLCSSWCIQLAQRPPSANRHLQVVHMAQMHLQLDAPAAQTPADFVRQLLLARVRLIILIRSISLLILAIIRSLFDPINLSISFVILSINQ